MGISKDSVDVKLRSNTKLFYGYSLAESTIPLIDEYSNRDESRNKLCITVDKNLFEREIGPFDRYLKDSILAKMYDANPAMGADITIIHEDSKRIPLLQVADYVASATYRKIARGNSTYYDMISDKIKYRAKWDRHSKISW